MPKSGNSNKLSGDPVNATSNLYSRARHNSDKAAASKTRAKTAADMAELAMVEGRLADARKAAARANVQAAQAKTYSRAASDAATEAANIVWTLRTKDPNNVALNTASSFSSRASAVAASATSSARFAREYADMAARYVERMVEGS